MHHDLELFELSQELDDSEVSQLEYGVDSCETTVNRNVAKNGEIDDI